MMDKRFLIGGLLLLASFVVVRTPGNQSAERAQLVLQCQAQGSPAVVCSCAASAVIDALGWWPFVPFSASDALQQAMLPGGVYPQALERCAAGR